jgi:2-methylcitrate dehydratase PrpD
MEAPPLPGQPARPVAGPPAAARSGSSFAAELTRFVVDVRPTEKVLAAAKRCLLDLVGVALAGSRDVAAHLVRGSSAASLDRNGPCTVFGSTEKADAEAAALCNAVAAHALDFDDLYWPGRVHPSAPVAPVVLALGEELGVTGREVVEALAVGVEVACRTGEWLGLDHYRAGWHTTSTAGTIAAAAAASRLLKLELAPTGHAMGIAASMASGLRANFGTMTKALHVGRAAAGGIRAARLAASGFTASPLALDGAHGLRAASTNRLEPTEVDQSPGGFRLLEPGITFKLYAACGLARCAVDAALGLVQQLDLQPNVIERIECGVSQETLDGMPFLKPETAIEAKFSLPYCLATTVLDRQLGHHQFTEELLHRPELPLWLDRVRVSVDPRLPRDSPGATVSIRTSDGTVLTRRIDDGSDSAPPVSDDQLMAKFLSCASVLLPQDAIAKLSERLLRLERNADIADLLLPVQSVGAEPGRELV